MTSEHLTSRPEQVHMKVTGVQCVSVYQDSKGRGEGKYKLYKNWPIQEMARLPKVRQSFYPRCLMHIMGPTPRELCTDYFLVIPLIPQAPLLFV